MRSQHSSCSSLDYAAGGGISVPLASRSELQLESGVLPSCTLQHDERKHGHLEISEQSVRSAHDLVSGSTDSIEHLNQKADPVLNSISTRTACSWRLSWRGSWNRSRLSVWCNHFRVGNRMASMAQTSERARTGGGPQKPDTAQSRATAA